MANFDAFYAENAIFKQIESNIRPLVLLNSLNSLRKSRDVETVKFSTFPRTCMAIMYLSKENLTCPIVQIS